MKHPISLFMVCLLSTAVLSAHPAVNGWEELGLKGNVSQRTKLYGDPDWEEDCTRHFFNRQGETTRHVDCEAPGGHNYTYIRDDLGRVVEIRESFEDYEFGAAETWKYLVYDPQGVLATVLEYHSLTGGGLWREYFYDERELKIREHQFGWDGQLEKVIYSEFDDSGFLVNETTCDRKGAVMHKRVITNDADGHVIYEEIYDPSGVLMLKSNHRYTFDAAGNILSDIITDEYSKDSPGPMLLNRPTDMSYYYKYIYY